jgi:hypothetical protein
MWLQLPVIMIWSRSNIADKVSIGLTRAKEVRRYNMVQVLIGQGADLNIADKASLDLNRSNKVIIGLSIWLQLPVVMTWSRS